MKKKAQLARPSNLPGKRPGRKMKIGPCSKCGVEGRLIKGFCKRCYCHKRYLARPGVAKRIAERAAKKKEKQLRREKWRAAHPRVRPEIKKETRGRPRRGSPSWVAEWLKHQTENYLHSNARHFDRNGNRLWAMTEDQVIDLCRIIYMAVDRHRGIKGEGPRTDYAHRQKEGEERTGRGSPGEWDKYEDFVDHRISSSFRHGFSRIREKE